MRARCPVPLALWSGRLRGTRSIVELTPLTHTHTRAHTRTRARIRTLRMTLYNVRWDDARAHTHTDGIGEHSHARATKAHGSQCLLQPSKTPPPLAKNEISICKRFSSGTHLSHSTGYRTRATTTHRGPTVYRQHTPGL